MISTSESSEATPKDVRRYIIWIHQGLSISLQQNEVTQPCTSSIGHIVGGLIGWYGCYSYVTKFLQQQWKITNIRAVALCLFIFHLEKTEHLICCIDNTNTQLFLGVCFMKCIKQQLHANEMAHCAAHIVNRDIICTKLLYSVSVTHIDFTWAQWGKRQLW